MKINIYSIVKPSNDDFDKLIKEFIKMSSKYAKVEIFYIFNKDIAKAQTIGENESKKIYTKSYLPYLKGYNIALDVLGKSVDSFGFSKLLKDKNEDENHNRCRYDDGIRLRRDDAQTFHCRKNRDGRRDDAFPIEKRGTGNDGFEYEGFNPRVYS